MDLLGIKEEKKLFKKGFRVIAGVDEAGRGPLAGPVVAAAVCVSDRDKFVRQFLKLNFINDSKKISRKKREAAAAEIKKTDFLKWAVGVCSEKEIDNLGILKATKRAMKKAVAALGGEPDFVLLDGNFILEDLPISQKAIIRGDERVFLIAAASIVAKTHRDAVMEKYCREYPNYGFSRHKGYGTRNHFVALKRYGPCAIHRRTFNLSLGSRRP